MPTYDYRCEACGHQLEHFQSIREPALRKCPKCKKPKLERLIGPGAGILFKGGGFYQTDYRSENYKRGESSEKDSGKPASEAASSAESGKGEKSGGTEKSETPRSEKGSEKETGKRSEKGRSQESGKPAKKKPA